MNDKLTRSPGTCKEKECKVLTTGECYEGNEDPNICPNYLAIVSAVDEISPKELEDFSANGDSEDLEYEKPQLIKEVEYPAIGKDLYSGRELDYETALRFTRSSLARVIVLAGVHDTGKTTLLASLYELFQAGPVFDYLFAASETLPAFDERAHLSRTDSGRDKEDTERSKSSSEQTMLHLCVRDKKMLSPRLHLLISDIWGEFFKNAINSKAEAEKLKLLLRADHVVVLIDGAKVSSLGTRNQAVTAAKMMLRSFIEAKMIGQSSLVEIVFSKGDLIDNADDSFETKKFLEQTETEIKNKFEDKVKKLTFRKIAARPEEGITPYGLKELLSNWIEFTPFLDSPEPEKSYKVTSQRRCDLFSSCQMPSKFH